LLGSTGENRSIFRNQTSPMDNKNTERLGSGFIATIFGVYAIKKVDTDIFSIVNSKIEPVLS